MTDKPQTLAEQIRAAKLPNAVAAKVRNVYAAKLAELREAA